MSKAIQHELFGSGRGPKMPPAPPGKKRCAGCEKLQSRRLFNRDPKSSDGLRSRCKQCRYEDEQRYRARRKAYSWRLHYGLSEEEYWRLHASQGGVCAICKQPETQYKKGMLQMLSVDHDHSDGRVRGLLCAKCNVKLAVIDNTEWTRSAFNYLGETR